MIAHRSLQATIETYFGGRACLLALPAKVEERGTLLPLEFDALPFTPRRCFSVGNVLPGTARGRHAHRTASQFLVCLSGRIRILMRADGEDVEIDLADNSSGLLIGPGIWAQQTYMTENAVLLVLASEAYDPASYVSDAEEEGSP